MNNFEDIAKDILDRFFIQYTSIKIKYIATQLELQYELGGAVEML